MDRLCHRRSASSDCATGRAAGGSTPSSRRPARARPSTSTGPGPGADAAQPVAHRLRRDLLGRAGPPRADRGRAPGGRRAPTSACSPSRAPRRPGGAPRGSPRAARRRRTRRWPASRWPPVTTTAAGPERVDRAGERLGVGVGLGVRQRGGLRQVRRDHRDPRQQPLAQRAPRRPRRAAARRSRPPSPGRAPPARPPTRSSARSTASIVSRVPSMPIFTASTPMSSATARTCSTIASGGSG